MKSRSRPKPARGCILNNDLDAPAHETAGLYKRRWQIELFFRMMKKTLKITKFLGRPENVVADLTPISHPAITRVRS